MGVVCGMHGRNAYRICVGKPEKRIPLERQRVRREDNIKMYPKETVRENQYDSLFYSRFVSMIMKHQYK